MQRDGVELGTHSLTLHAAGVAFNVTTLDDVAAYECQLRRLLNVLPLRAWQWINIHHTEMTFITLMK